MTTGSVALVLHSHLPYARLAGGWPHGEEWVHEALLECYLPLAQALGRLAAERAGSLGVTLSITPILAEQLADATIISHFDRYVDDRIARARRDGLRFRDAERWREPVAEFHMRRYEETRAFWRAQDRNVLGVFARLEATGAIEIATSAATHGYLPLLEDDAAVRFQVDTGIAAHERRFGRRPRSFWLPECAYRPGLERVLDAADIRVFFVETHLVTGGRPATLPRIGPYSESSVHVDDAPASVAAETHGSTFRAYRVGSSSVGVMARNERTGLQVWSAAWGYPGDGAYREFHKRDSESGLHYWRVTAGGLGLGDKQGYSPERARQQAEEHAGHFAGVVEDELEGYHRQTGQRGLLMASYDTELFGHWWLEGVRWLEGVIRRLRASESVAVTSASAYIDGHPPAASITLPEGSWGGGGDHRTWRNEVTAWTWPVIHARQRRAGQLLRRDTAATRQLARELLLLQSSDWQFLMTTGQASDYAVERFNGHVTRFDRLAECLESGDDVAAERVAAELYAIDNPFPAIQPLRYGAA